MINKKELFSIFRDKEIDKEIEKDKDKEVKNDTKLKEAEYNDNIIKSFNNKINNNLYLIRNILELPKQNRTKENLNFLLDIFKDLDFFRLGIVNYGINIIYDFLECCCLLELNENSVILNSKENAKSAYILISGDILISTKEAIFEQKPKSKFLKKQFSSGVFKFLLRKSTNFSIDKLEEDKANERINENEEENKKIKNGEKLIIENWHVKIGEMFADKSLIERKIR